MLNEKPGERRTSGRHGGDRHGRWDLAAKLAELPLHALSPSGSRMRRDRPPRRYAAAGTKRMVASPT